VPSPQSQGWIKWWASWTAAQGANLKGELKRHWNKRKYGASKLRFPHAKEFLQKLSAIWAHTLKNVSQPSSKLKQFKEY
jgi:hypothetical protein